VLGSTADGVVYEPPTGDEGFTREGRTTTAPIDSFTSTSHPPSAYRNSLTDSILIRRAWAEVTNRELGQVRFGRMGSHWGLGLLANDGRGIDGDYSSDVDRLMVATKIAGFYGVAGYDFASEGYTQQSLTDINGLAYDPGQEDDITQWVFAVARHMEEQDAADALARGEFVLDAGVYFVYRSQFLSSQAVLDPAGRPGAAAPFLVRRDAEAFIPDLWVRFRHDKLRLELEAAGIFGSIENIQIDSFVQDDQKLRMFGAAFQAEYRLLDDDELGIYLDAGFATGDSNVEGLTMDSGLPVQQDGNNTISTFRFHPNYRVDLILWRNIMRQVAGAYYFKPGISYDFIRGDYGELFGLRADLIWSRASSPVQAWGNDPDLGIEINASLYYRSEDGPEMLDGFYGSVQYGALFPMKGLGYLEEAGRTQVTGGNPELGTAQTLRLILGVEY
jgi:uncharacterized protein (TIGR04551 family)